MATPRLFTPLLTNYVHWTRVLESVRRGAIDIDVGLLSICSVVESSDSDYHERDGDKGQDCFRISVNHRFSPLFQMKLGHP